MQPMTSFDPTAEYAAIREGVARVCAEFPGAYWRDLDTRRAYPIEFVNALIREGYLAAMIPEEYGGSGLNLSASAVILEEIHRSGCNAAACHAQMYTMGTVLRHGSAEQKQQYLPRIADGSLRLQAFGVTEPTSGTDTLALKTTARLEGDEYVINGQKIWTSRAEHSDLMVLLARTTPRDQVKSKTEGLSVFLIDMREHVGKSITIRPIRTMMNHATTEVFFDNLRIPANALIGEEGKGFRYVLAGMNSERILIAAECIGDAKWFIKKAADYARERVIFGAPIGKNQGPYDGGRGDRLPCRRDVRFRAQSGGRGEHRQDARRRCQLGSSRGLPANPRRFWFCRGIRRRTQVPRGTAVSGGADLDQPHLVLHRGTGVGPAEILW
jgi:acyl-CoA dehydrogenase